MKPVQEIRCLTLPARLAAFDRNDPVLSKAGGRKRQIIEELLRNPGQIAQLNEGILPPYLHNLLRALMGMVFVTLMSTITNKKARKVTGTPSQLHIQLVEMVYRVWLGSQLFQCCSSCSHLNQPFQ
jgi:hypothetical protein